MPEYDREHSGLGVSVVIAARNEYDNLVHNLPSILEQDYDKFEVIVVNDRSEDDTVILLDTLSNQYPHLKTVLIKPGVDTFEGKKLALTLGIKAAKYDTILLTDADCKPLSKNWIQAMQSTYQSNDIQVVIGFSPYEKRKGLLNYCIQLETFLTGINYLSSAKNGNPYMGVGRNLSYKKSFFLDNKGFAPYLKLPSGDDDLFINMHANGKNTRVHFHPDSFMLSIPKTNWREWMQQKERHNSVAKYYRFSTKFWHILNWMLFLAFYINYLLTLVLLGITEVFLVQTGMVFLLFISQWIFAGIGSNKLKQSILWFLFPFTEIIYHFLYQPIVGMLGLMRNHQKAGW